jgi:hypothetical protein
LRKNEPRPKYPATPQKQTEYSCFHKKYKDKFDFDPRHSRTQNQMRSPSQSHFFTSQRRRFSPIRKMRKFIKSAAIHGLAMTGLMFLPQYPAHASMASGQYAYDFSGLVSLWDISGYYSGTLDTVTPGQKIGLDFSMTEYPSGKFGGIASLFLNDGLGNVLNGSGIANGAVTGSGSTARVTMTVLASGTGTDAVSGSSIYVFFRQTLRINGEIDVSGSNLMVTRGTCNVREYALATGKLIRSSSAKLGAGNLIPLAKYVDGTWGVSLNLIPLGTKYAGIGVIQTSPGYYETHTVENFSVTGKYSAKTDTTEISLKDGSCKLSLLISASGSGIAVKRAHGKLFGQNLKFEPKPGGSNGSSNNSGYQSESGSILVGSITVGSGNNNNTGGILNLAGGGSWTIVTGSNGYTGGTTVTGGTLQIVGGTTGSIGTITGTGSSLITGSNLISGTFTINNGTLINGAPYHLGPLLPGDTTLNTGTGNFTLDSPGSNLTFGTGSILNLITGTSGNLSATLTLHGTDATLVLDGSSSVLALDDTDGTLSGTGGALSGPGGALNLDAMGGTLLISSSGGSLVVSGSGGTVISTGGTLSLTGSASILILTLSP